MNAEVWRSGRMTGQKKSTEWKKTDLALLCPPQIPHGPLVLVRPYPLYHFTPVCHFCPQCRQHSELSSDCRSHRLLLAGRLPVKTRIYRWQNKGGRTHDGAPELLKPYEHTWALWAQPRNVVTPAVQSGCIRQNLCRLLIIPTHVFIVFLLFYILMLSSSVLHILNYRTL